MAVTKRKPRVNKNFGKDTRVQVISEESPYHNMVGDIVNGVISQHGDYLVTFGPPTGDQFIFANDLTDYEEVASAPEPQAQLQTDGESGQLVPLDDIFPDPGQPRKFYDELALQELANSIREHGLLQAILLRPYTYTSPGAAKYMIVIGERRFRASKLAGLTHIRSMVRNMSDEDVLEVQVIENLQREQVHEMLEARAFKTLHARLTLEEIARRISKSKSYVSVRLRFNNLIPVFQDIYLAGKMTFEDAQFLSRASAESQERILAEKTRRFSWEDEDWEIGVVEYLVDEASRDLDCATFKTEDPDLYPEMGACGMCPHNSAVNELFGDVEGRICSLPVCYGIKAQRAYELTLPKVATDPEIVMISGYAHGEGDNAKLKEAGLTGGIVLSERDYREVHREEEPTWDEFLKGQDRDDPDWDEAEARAEFDAEHNEWLAANASLERAQAEGRLKKAFVVAGNNAGSYKEVLLTDNGIAKRTALQGATGDIAADIGTLLDREKRAKDLDREKVMTKTYQLLNSQDGAAFNTNTGELTQPEWVGLILFLWNYVPLDLRSQIQKDFSLPTHHMQRGSVQLHDALSGLSTLGLELTLLRMVRPILLQQFAVRDNPDYLKMGECATMRAIALDYFPNAMSAMDLEQDEIARKRSERLNERIKELKGEKIVIRTDATRMAIKVMSTGVGTTGGTQGWKNLEKGFEKVEDMDARFNDLLATGKYAAG